MEKRNGAIYIQRIKTQRGRNLHTQTAQGFTLPHTTSRQKPTRGVATAACRSRKHSQPGRPHTPPRSNGSRQRLALFCLLRKGKRGRKEESLPGGRGSGGASWKVPPPGKRPGRGSLSCSAHGEGRRKRTGNSTGGGCLPSLRRLGCSRFAPWGRAWPCWAAPARASPRALIRLPPPASLAPAACAAEIRRRRGPARPR